MCFLCHLQNSIYLLHSVIKRTLNDLRIWQSNNDVGDDNDDGDNDEDDTDDGDNDDGDVGDDNDDGDNDEDDNDHIK
jgi:hypothetical protein